MIKTCFALAAAVVVWGPAAVAEDHRQLGAHEHGHGTLNVAIEGKTVSMELEVPGADIVGFEHLATTPEQKAAVEKASAVLSKPLELFVVAAAAGCTVRDAKVEVRAEDHDKGKADAGTAAKADHHDHDEPAHSEYHATYVLECTTPASLTAIDFAYFKAFAGAQKLTVNLITAKAQSAFAVSREKPGLDLAGVM